MRNTVYIVDVLENIVKDIATQLGIDVYYQYGSIQEIIENLKTMTTVGLGTDKKYPLVALLTDIEENSSSNTEIYSECNVNILIFNVTDNRYLAPERTTNSFKPILCPIYEQLLESINNSLEIHSDYNGVIEHSHYLRYYWGRVNETENPFSDYIDAIEIKNMKLKIKNKNC